MPVIQCLHRAHDGHKDSSIDTDGLIVAARPIPTNPDEAAARALLTVC
jgi:hypothetical protein